MIPANYMLTIITAVSAAHGGTANRSHPGKLVEGDSNAGQPAIRALCLAAIHVGACDYEDGVVRHCTVCSEGLHIERPYSACPAVGGSKSKLPKHLSLTSERCATFAKSRTRHVNCVGSKSSIAIRMTPFFSVRIST